MKLYHERCYRATISSPHHEAQRATTNAPKTKNTIVAIKCTVATLIQRVISFFVSVERTICRIIKPENNTATSIAPASARIRLSCKKLTTLLWQASGLRFTTRPAQRLPLLQHPFYRCHQILRPCLKSRHLEAYYHLRN